MVFSRFCFPWALITSYINLVVSAETTGRREDPSGRWVEPPGTRVEPPGMGLEEAVAGRAMYADVEVAA